MNNYIHKKKQAPPPPPTHPTRVFPVNVYCLHSLKLLHYIYLLTKLYSMQLSPSSPSPAAPS